MSNTPHELAQEFPNQGAIIQKLKQADTRFAAVVDDYVAINRRIHRAETRVDRLSEAEETALRLQRVHLKDQIARALAAV